MKRKCAICGKETESGFLFDGTTLFCSKECATKFFDNDDGCVEILIDEGDRLVWHGNFSDARDVHYVVSIGNDGTILYSDSWRKVITWLNEKLGEKFVCGDDIRYYNENHDEKVSILHHLYKTDDVRKFYKNRREYVSKVRECEDNACKAQRLPRSLRRDRYLDKFFAAYDKVNELWEKYPTIWQGEI